MLGENLLSRYQLPSVTYGVTLLACHLTTCLPEVLSKLRAPHFRYISFFICMSLAFTVNQRMTLNSRPSCFQLSRTGIKACTSVLDVCATGDQIQSLGFARQESHHLGCSYILLPSSCFAVVRFSFSVFEIRSCCLDGAALELSVFLPQPPEC